MTAGALRPLRIGVPPPRAATAPVPAVFLDRDGVLIENVETYVRSQRDVAMLPGAARALRRIGDLGYLPVIVTNQAVVGKGLISRQQALVVHEFVLAQLRREGATVALSLLCPHRAEAGCDCRKPRPGMVLAAARQAHLDLAGSVLVGDAMTDVQAARAAGVAPILVRTGRGEAQLKAHSRDADLPVASDLAEVADLLSGHSPGGRKAQRHAATVS
jgi:D-glycero-D-manno-heptose 1,7-bisphosphate phosphatase